MIDYRYGIPLIVQVIGIAAPAAAQQMAPPPDRGVQAEASDALPESEISDIIVTATKRSESINRVPMSITAATGETLTRAGITDVASLAKVVPGFNAVDSSYGSPVYYLRGVGFFETTLLAKSTVGVYIDEVPLPYPVMTSGASFDLERVEVLKGPQGTIFGSNATGGAINYIAAKPTTTWHAGLNGSFGRFARGSVNGYVSGPLTDTLAVRLSLGQELGGNWQKSTTRDATLGERDLLQGRFQLSWKPTSAFRAHLSINGFIDRSDTQAAQFIGGFLQTTSTVVNPAIATYPLADRNNRQADWGDTNPLRRDDRMFQAALRLEGDLTDAITVTSLSAYSYFRRKQGQDSDGLNLRLADLYITGSINSYFQEMRLNGDFGAGGNWVLGGNYERSSGPERVDQTLLESSTARAFLGLGLPLLDVIPQASDTKFTSKAVFANVDYSVGERVTLHAGGRYTRTNTHFEACAPSGGNGVLVTALSRILRIAPVPLGACATIIHPTGPGSNGFGGIDADLPEDNFSWRVGADFNIDSGTLIYANVSRGYKSGSFSNLPASDVGQYKPVTQEELTAYEVGFKSSLFDKTLQLNGAAFYYDYKDKQLKGRTNVPIFNFLEALVNIPKSRIVGAEVQATWLPLSGLRFNLGGTYLDTKITSSFSNFTVFGAPIDFQGFGFSNTPRWQGNADAEYRWATGGSRSAYIGASLTYRSKTSGDFKPDPRLAINAYTLLDLRAGLEGPDNRWRIGVFGRNVTDTHYWTTAARRNDAIVRFAGMPATYGIDFSVRY